MENNKLKTHFEYTDEFNSTTKLSKTHEDYINVLEEGSFDFLVDEFKMFMLACGFSQKLVNSIQIVEE